MGDYLLELIAPPSAPNAGRVLEQLVEANFTEPIEWVRRGYGSMSFSMPVDARRTAHIKPLETEVRVSFKGAPIWQGPVVDDDFDDTTATFHCLEVPWYLFAKRHVGGAGRKNHLTNGSFENGLGGWGKSPKPPAHTIVDVGRNAILGSKVVRLSTDGVGDPDRPGNRDEYFISQVDGIAVGSRKGSRWTARAYFRLNAQRIAPHRDRGLRVRLWNGANGKTLQESVFPIGDHTTRGQWIKAVASVVIPKTIADPRITVFLYAPHDGVIDWDAAGLFYRYALLDGNTDAVAAVRALVAHAQDRRYGKSPLRLKVSGRPAGRATDARFFHDEHVNVGKALNQLRVDWWFNPATRTIETYGRGRPVNEEVTFEIGRHVGEFKVHRVGSKTVTRVITLAKGSGADREEGSASRKGRFAGMVYESVIGSDAKVRNLDQSADEMVDRRARLVVLPEIVTDGTESLIRKLRVGGRHPVTLHAGRRRSSGVERVDRLLLDTTSNKMTVRFVP